MTGKKRTFLVRLWHLLSRPTARYSLGGVLIVGGVAGVMGWGAFNWAMELTNTETFCTACHEMRDTPYKELKETIHFSNAAGVAAICSDCHVPKKWIYKVARKIRATNELFHKIMGTVNTPQKFEAKRIELARHVWRTMKETDSRECRNCHSFETMKADMQSRPARKKHAKAVERGQTCIECHQGIAHHLPDDWEDAWDAEFGT